MAFSLPPNPFRPKVALAALGLAACGLAGSAANAQTFDLQTLIDTCTEPGILACSTGDKNFWDIVFDPKGSAVTADSITISATNNGFFYNIQASFGDISTAPPANLQDPISIGYKVQITEPNFVFRSVTVSSTIAGDATGGDTITKELYDLDFTSDPDGAIGSLIDSIAAVNGVPETTTAIDGKTALYVLDDYSPVVQGFASANNNFTQRFVEPPTEVPAPLPLLGAGVAFGFSRNLRRRIASAKS